jgi:hypothetical protein
VEDGIGQLEPHSWIALHGADQWNLIALCVLRWSQAPHCSPASNFGRGL